MLILLRRALIDRLFIILLLVLKKEKNDELTVSEEFRGRHGSGACALKFRGAFPANLHPGPPPVI